jgi:hypothetical protein
MCCEGTPGPDGIVPVSVTKAAVYRGISVVGIGALTLAFGNTLSSAAIVTGVIATSRTAIYVVNDYVWNRIDVGAPVGPVEASWPSR